MGGFGDDAADRALDALLGSGDPATVYLALFTAAPDDTGGGTEVAGGSYARVAVVNDATNWPAAAARQKSNGVEFTYPTATAPWGDVSHWAAMDAASAGTLICWGALAAVQTVPTGATPTWPVGALVAVVPA